MYVKIAGAWANTACTADWGYFQAVDNPSFMAMALTARRNNTALRITVDDTQAKVGGICQIVNMAL
jgi:hypothetical protein